MEICNRHDEVAGQLKIHEERILALEISDAKQKEQIKNLCKELSNLTSWIKALVVTIIGSLVTFFIWYIQTMGR